MKIPYIALEIHSVLHKVSIRCHQYVPTQFYVRHFFNFILYIPSCRTDITLEVKCRYKYYFLECYSRINDSGKQYSYFLRCHLDKILIVNHTDAALNTIRQEIYYFYGKLERNPKKLCSVTLRSLSLLNQLLFSSGRTIIWNSNSFLFQKV